MKQSPIISLLPQKGYPFGHNIHFAFDHATAHFVFVHPSFAWAVTNDAGCSVSALVSRLVQEELIPLDDTYQKAVQGVFEGTFTVKLEDNERYRWIMVTPYLVDHGGAALLIGTATEITDQIINNESITKYANKKNSILHMLGHDLRGPLNVAKSLIKLMNEEATDAAAINKSRSIATILQQSVDLIGNLVSREFVETTGTVLVKKLVDINWLLKDYIEECQRSADLAHRQFTFTSSTDHISISIDDMKIMQVVNNLLSNALKFTLPGGSIKLDLTDLGQQVQIRFSDDGIGIPEKLLPMIFDQFTEARRPGIQGEPTLGLGLSIVKTIIDWHGGNISCESTVGKGTTFLINLPKNTQA